MAKGQDKKRSAKSNKPKLTQKEKKEKKLAKQGVPKSGIKPPG